MYQAVTFARGVSYATLGAGPVFIASLGLAAIVGSPEPVAAESAWMMLLALTPPVIVAGAFLAIVPNLLGAALLAIWGSANDGFRLPIAWGLTGGLAAAVPAAILSEDTTATLCFAATGTICALLCRAGTRWPA